MEDIEEYSNFSTKALYDVKLVERALKHDDQKAFAELMKRYWEPVYFMLLRMITNKDDAEDLTIEAFAKAFRSLSQYSTNFAFSTWLFKIASNNAIDFLRRNKEHKTVASLNRPYGEEGSEELSSFIKSSGLNPEESFIRKQNIDRIRVIVEKLKPRYREMVELFYIEELSVEEIAKRVDLPISTVKTRLFRARDFLHTIVTRHQGF